MLRRWVFSDAALPAEQKPPSVSRTARGSAPRAWRTRCADMRGHALLGARGLPRTGALQR